MIYQVVVPKRAQKELKRIPDRFRKRVIVALAALAYDPFCGKKLVGKYVGNWSLRVWPYRIIYKIKKRELIVLVVKIGHRQTVYK